MNRGERGADAGGATKWVGVPAPPAPPTLPGGQYTERWFAYLDVLGFEALVKEAHAKGEAGHAIWEFWRIAGIVQGLLDTFVFTGEGCAVEEPVAQVRIFSDTICVRSSRPADDNGVVPFLEALVRVTAELANNRWFVRGAVVRGYHYDDDRIVLSPALVRAYHLAEEEAFYPRIIADERVCEAYRSVSERMVRSEQRGCSIFPALYRDDDGRHFVNYLFASKLRPASEEARFLHTHKERVEECLADYREDPRKRAKYGWVAHYHNRFCEVALPDAEERQALLIGEEGMGPWLRTTAPLSEE